MKSFSIVALAGLLTMLAILGCSTAKVSSSDLEQIKSQMAPEGKALVYIIRPKSAAYLVTFKVSCDEKPIGSTGAKRFIYILLNPGLHKFVSNAENTSELFLEVESGKKYFLEQKLKMGLLTARNELVRLDEAAGMKKLKSCKLSGDCLAWSK